MLAKDENEWKEQLQKLITDAQLRTDIGRDALKCAWKNWSYNKSTSQSLFRKSCTDETSLNLLWL